MNHRTDAVTVIGLNPRGAALAKALTVAGTRVTVWDDTEPGPSAGTPPVDDLVRAESLQTAFTASAVIVVCVEDYDTVERFLTQVEPSVDGAEIVNLTSGTSADAERVADWVNTRGGRYLDGALMAHPEHVGHPDTVLVVSGSAEVFERHQSALAQLGGVTYLGVEAGTAALYDVAMLNFAWATLIGFLQTAALLGTADVPATTVTPLLTRWLSSTITEVITDYAGQIDDHKYPGDEEWLELDAPLMNHLIEAARTRGIDTALPELVQSLTARGIDAGYGKDSFASLIEVLRA